MPELKPKLKVLLATSKIEPVVVDEFVRLKCLGIEDFANWMEDRSGLKAVFLDGTNMKDDPGQLARIKMAWRQADAMTTRALGRQASGQAADDLDEPLDPSISGSLHDAFKHAYSWT